MRLDASHELRTRLCARLSLSDQVLKRELEAVVKAEHEETRARVDAGFREAETKASQKAAQASEERADNTLAIIAAVAQSADSVKAHTDAKIDSVTAYTDAKIDNAKVHTDAKIDSVKAHTDAKIVQVEARFIALLSASRTDTAGAAISLLRKRLDPLAVEAFIARGLEAYFPGTRQSVVRACQTFLSDPSRRLFWICGDAGVGKSVISAMLCDVYGDSVAGFHYCLHNSAERRDPKRVLMSLAFQLSTRLSAYRANLEKVLQQGDASADLKGMSVLDLFGKLLVQPLKGVELGDEKGRPEGGLVFVIDALDESESGGDNPLLKLLGNFDQMDLLPRWIRWVVTSRPLDGIKKMLKRYNPLDIQCTTEENLADVGLYLRGRLVPLLAPSEDLEQCAELLAAKAKGLFIYSRHVLEGKKEGSLTRSHIEAFPDTMDDFYLDTFARVRERMGTDDWQGPWRSWSLVVPVRRRRRGGSRPRACLHSRPRPKRPRESARSACTTGWPNSRPFSLSGESASRCFTSRWQTG
jgi:hypothetical protein